MALDHPKASRTTDFGLGGNTAVDGPPPPPQAPAPQTPAGSRHPRRPRRRLVSAAVLGIAVLGVAGGLLGSNFSSSGGPQAVVPTAELQQLQATLTHAVPPNASTAPINPSAVTNAVAPGLVVVNTTLSYQGEEAAGTGMVLTSTGLVLTNNHVIEGETTLRATDLGNGKTYTASVLGYDRSHDVALLQLANASGLKTVTLADSALAKVGESVTGIGNADGTGKATPATGSIAALNQSITATDSSAGTSEQLNGLIETTADIIPGDSGGPLVDASGHVIGMDTAGSSTYNLPSATGQGFAIPISDAVTVAQEIADGQASSTVHIGPTAFLGVGVSAPQGASALGATISVEINGGPAAVAGLVPGDTIVAVNGQAVTSPTALTQQLINFKPGTTITVAYMQLGVEHTTHVKLTSGPPQ
jgi:S1-C subfamily serine protease